METFILNSKSKKDVKLLMDVARKLGLDLKIADRRDLVLAQAKSLNNTVEPNRIPLSEIVDTSKAVRKERHEKGQKNNS